MQKVLVAGSTGYLGGFVVKELKKQNYFVKVLARSESKIAEFKEFIDDFHIGEVTQASSLKNICSGIDVVFSSIGITKQKDGLTYLNVDYNGNLNLLEDAKKNGVKKFIYISSLGAEKMPCLRVTAAKQKFVLDLKSSGMAYTVFYPNGFFSDMLEILDMARKGRGYLFGNGEYKINPIHGEDLAEACVKSIESNETEIEIGGPDIFTQKQLFEIACQAINKVPKTTFIPIWIVNLLLWFLRTFTSERIYGPHEFILTALAMDMIAPAYGKHHLLDFYKTEAIKNCEAHQ